MIGSLSCVSPSGSKCSTDRIHLQVSGPSGHTAADIIGDMSHWDCKWHLPGRTSNITVINKKVLQSNRIGTSSVWGIIKKKLWAAECITSGWQAYLFCIRVIHVILTSGQSWIYHCLSLLSSGWGQALFSSPLSLGRLLFLPSLWSHRNLHILEADHKTCEKTSYLAPPPKKRLKVRNPRRRSEMI